MRNTTKLGGASLALAAGALLAGTLASRPSDAAMDKQKRLSVMKSVVLLVTLAQRDGQIVGVADLGSGTSITSRGHILTANHVITFRHPLPDGITIVPEMLIYLTPENNADPAPVCTFDPSHMPRNPDLDIAMVMCEHDLKGDRWDSSAVSWPHVTLGDPASMTQGDDLWIFGYPAAGQDPRKKLSLPTMNVSQGKFAGVINEQGDFELTHHIAWIKTDAEISGGNSGGCATDDDGNYLGSPNEVHVDARGEAGTLGHVGFIRPTNVFQPFIAMAARGWVPGAPRAARQARPTEGVMVTGVVVSAETGDPVAGMIITVFKQGVSAGQVQDADNPSALVLSLGQSRTDGTFSLRTRVPKGHYTVAVFGQGYKLLIEDDVLVIDDSTPPVYQPWKTIKVTRCTSGTDCGR